MSKQKVLILGAGISGLRVAQLLPKSLYEVIVVEKGRGVGGRMATRRFDDTKADHGAQYFSVKTSVFQDFIEKAEQHQIVKQWQVANRTHTRYICPAGMNTLPKWMAEGLDIRLNQKITQLSEGTATTDTGEQYTFDILVITAPIPQVLELFQSSNILPDESESLMLRSIHYDPCWVVMAKLKDTNTQIIGGKILEEGPVAWVVDNAEKGLTTISTLTIHASSNYSEEHLEDASKEVATVLIDSISDIIHPDQIESHQVHRWRYSLASQRTADSFLKLKKYPIYIGGDAFGMGNVEGAFLSGESIARSMM